MYYAARPIKSTIICAEELGQIARPSRLFVRSYFESSMLESRNKREKEPRFWEELKISYRHYTSPNIYEHNTEVKSVVCTLGKTFFTSLI